MTVQTEIKLVIGAGPYNNNPGWIHTQEDELSLLNPSQWEKSFQPESVSAILAEHVWEHLTFEEGVEGAKLCRRFLKKSGCIRCAVPDGFFPDKDYQKLVQIGGPGPADHVCATHQIVYTYQTLTSMFEEAGFKVLLLEYCDEKGTPHFTDWDGERGVIFRSKKYDPRNQGEHLQFASLIVDAVKV